MQNFDLEKLDEFRLALLGEMKLFFQAQKRADKEAIVEGMEKVQTAKSETQNELAEKIKDFQPLNCGDTCGDSSQSTEATATD